MEKSKRILLYYPSIVIRNPGWIRKSILYWDEIRTIVPAEQTAQILIETNKDIRALRRIGAYSSFNPEPYVTDNTGFADEFIAIIESNDFQQNFLRGISGEGIDLYPAKMHHRLAKYLVSIGLGRINHHTKMLNVQRSVAYLYMSILAKFLAEKDENDNVVPGTDYALYQTLIYKADNDDNGIPGMSLNLQNLLPTPRSDVSIEQILEFKEKHQIELAKFNKFLYDSQNALRSSSSSKELKEQLFFFSEELKINLHQLLDIAQSEKIPLVLGAVETIFKIEAPAILGVLALGLTIPSEISIGGSLVVGAVTLSKYILDKRNEKKQRLSSNPYSYLYYAQEKGIINRP